MVIFVASKLIGALLQPGTLTIPGLAAIVSALALYGRVLALWVGSVALSLLLALAILSRGDLHLPPIERTYPAPPPLGYVDRIIVQEVLEYAAASAFWD